MSDLEDQHGGGDGKPAQMPSGQDHHGGDPMKSLLGSAGSKREESAPRTQKKVD